MKRFVWTICLVVAMAANVAAGVMEFSKLRIEVPEGWTAKEEDKAISLFAPGNVAAISVVWDDSGGLPAKDLAQAMSAQLKGTKPVPDEGGYSFTFRNKSGVKSKSFLFAGGKEYTVLTVTGEHPQLGRVLQSFQSK